MRLSPPDIASLERATVEAFAPVELVEIGDWLVPLDTGTIARAKSAVPLHHAVGPEAIPEIEAAYQARSLKAGWRVAEAPGLRRTTAELARKGYQSEQPTLVMVADAHDVAAIAPPFADLLDKPDKAWAEVFAGEGFDADDGAFRVARLSQAPDALYGAVREGGRTTAVGVVSFGHGWAGIHGMRTSLDRRGAGLASRLIALFGAAALARQVSRVVLQVAEGNRAQALYRRAGFQEAWRYRYWK